MARILGLILPFQLLSLIFLSVDHASARDSAGEQYGKYFLGQRAVSNLAAKAPSAAMTVGRSIAKETQAMFLMATVAAMDGVRQQREISEIKGQKMTDEERSKAFFDSAEHLLTASETVGGIGGMYVTNAATRAPLETMTSLIGNSFSRPLLVNLISQHAASLVGFIGFDSAAELTKRAVEMIEFP